MSNTDVGRLWPPGLVSGAVGMFMTISPSGAANNLSGAAHKLAVVFDVPVSGELHSFEYWAGSSGSISLTVRASWQDVDPSDNPDGVVDQFCLYPVIASHVSAEWMIPPNAFTHDGSAGGTRRTVTRGQRIAAVLDFSAYTSGIWVALGWSSGYASHGAQLRQFGTVWSAVNQTPAMAVRYTDGYRAVFGAIPTGLTPTWTNVNSGSSPNHRAMIWTQTANDTCVGLWAHISGTGACDLVLFEGTTEVGRLRWAIVVSTPGTRVGYFSTPIALTAGLVYRAAVVPTTPTTVTARAFTAHAADAQLGSIPDVVAGMGQSTKTGDAGPWTDSTAAIPMVGPVVVSGAAGGGNGGPGPGTTTTGPTWPATLPQAPLIVSYDETAPTMVRRSSVDAGAPKVGRRVTANVAPISCAYPLTREQVAILDAFYFGAAGGGGVAFNWPHPRLLGLVRVRFREAPKYTNAGHPDTAWTASVALEVLPPGMPAV